jgi:hypothetical protein
MNDLSAKRELSHDAKALIEDKAFSAAILDLRKRWFDELMTAADTTERKLELIGQIKALEALTGALGAIINDYTMAARNQRHG